MKRATKLFPEVINELPTPKSCRKILYRVKKDGDYKIKVQKTVDPETSEALLYCHSTRKEPAIIADRFIKSFEDTMQKIAEGLHKKI